MPLHILNSDWLSQNANRNYPLDDAATCTSVDEAFILPPTFLLDLVWPVHVSLGNDPRNFFIGSIVSSGDTVIVTLSYLREDNVTAVVAGSFVIAVAAHQPGAVYTVTGTGDFSDSAGNVVVGDLEGVLSQGGMYTFDIAGSRISQSCIRPNLRGVSSIRVETAEGVSDPLTGDVYLNEGRNFRITYEGNGVIRFDAVSLPDHCACDERRAVRTINGVEPDVNGNIELIGDECFEIRTAEALLRFVDLCSTSCCGCAQLEPLHRDMETWILNMQQLSSLLTKLEGKVDVGIVNALASIVNDPNCGG